MPQEQRDEVEMLSMMLLIRRFEERASQQYQAQKIGGFCHLYIGQEAVVAGAIAATRPDDYIITAYRDHAHALARGTSADACMAELFGKVTGCSRGLGGSMHFFDKENHMYGGHAIVGAHVPLAAGMAFASKYRKEDRVTLCFFGDGAINQGAFHEALNLAGLFKLPVIFICENNFFAMGTSVKRSTSLEQIVDRAEGYDMPGEIVDGMSFREVRDKLGEIIASIRKDPHPAFVEARTYRYRGHSMSDPASYRTKEELEKYRLEDPITRLRAQLTREGKLTNEKFDVLDKEAKEAAMASVKFAEKSAEPPLEDLHAYTYADDGNEPQDVAASASPAKTSRASKPMKNAPAKSRPTRDAAAGQNGDAADTAAATARKKA
ncbi:MAG: pyruvate dehydrogenase (acetyl-transferring) E1 component subunit alpha [Spartobacteria bacterium]